MIKVYEYYEFWISRMGDTLHCISLTLEQKKPIYLLAYHLPLQK